MGGLIDLLNFILYCLQQLGIVLGVGGEVVFLFLYVSATKDQMLDDTEKHFARSVARITNSGLIIVLLSGIGITVVHFLTHQDATVFEPAFIAKWTLIFFLLAISRKATHSTVQGWVSQGLAGGTWFALFLIHVVAPVTTWAVLLVAYIVWMGIFFAFWTIAILASRIRKTVIQTSPAALYPTPQIPVSSPQPVAQPIQYMAPVATSPVPQEILIQPTLAPIPPQAKITLPQQSQISPNISLPLLPFPYINPLQDDTEVLHPHLTENTQAVLLKKTLVAQASDVYVSEHLPALRIMPTKPEDLETQHKGPHIKFG